MLNKCQIVVLALIVPFHTFDTQLLPVHEYLEFVYQSKHLLLLISEEVILL